MNWGEAIVEDVERRAREDSPNDVHHRRAYALGALRSALEFMGEHNLTPEQYGRRFIDRRTKT